MDLILPVCNETNGNLVPITQLGRDNVVAGRDTERGQVAQVMVVGQDRVVAGRVKAVVVALALALAGAAAPVSAVGQGKAAAVRATVTVSQVGAVGSVLDRGKVVVVRATVMVPVSLVREAVMEARDKLMVDLGMDMVLVGLAMAEVQEADQVLALAPWALVTDQVFQVTANNDTNGWYPLIR